MKYCGTIIIESLDSETCLKDLLIVKRETWHSAGKAPYQPATWNVAYFENDDDSIGDVIEDLSFSIKEKWFIDISAGQKKYIVFKNKAFDYDQNNMAGKGDAIEYGKRVGIPESQLDWPDFVTEQ